MSTLLLMCADGFSLLADEPSGHIPQGLLDRARPIAIFNGKHTGRYIRLAAFPTICSILRMVT